MLMARGPASPPPNQHLAFCRHISLGVRTVAEPVETIRGSYAMISPDGRFFDSSTGRHQYSRPILQVGLTNAFSEISFDAAKYDGRDGNYNSFTGESQSFEQWTVA
jgi:radical S-adenosyl methionine domain-containing protein 2